MKRVSRGMFRIHAQTETRTVDSSMPQVGDWVYRICAVSRRASQGGCAIDDMEVGRHLIGSLQLSAGFCSTWSTTRTTAGFFRGSRLVASTTLPGYWLK